MTTTLIAISAAYVVMGVLLLSVGLTAPFRWWLKAGAIVLVSGFFVEVFFATKGLLGWPGTGRLPARFQLLWTRVVEPDPKIHDAGSIFLWVEEVDENDVPVGTPRSYRLAYTKPLAERSLKARDEIMSGNPQEGTANDVEDDDEDQNLAAPTAKMPENATQTDAPPTGPLNLSLLNGALRDPNENVQFRPRTGPALPEKR
jgi:hypothetical protein